MGGKEKFEKLQNYFKLKEEDQKSILQYFDMISNESQDEVNENVSNLIEQMKRDMNDNQFSQSQITEKYSQFCDFLNKLQSTSIEVDLIRKSL